MQRVGFSSSRGEQQDEWTGPPLWDVLALSGVVDAARSLRISRLALPEPMAIVCWAHDWSATLRESTSNEIASIKMVRENEVRAAEVAVEAPAPTDAGLVFIGRIRTPWTSRLVAPRQGRPDGPICQIEIFDHWVPALRGLESYQRVEVLYWLHLSRRDLILQSPANDGSARGTFSLRSPVRPNPIGSSIAHLERIDGGSLYVCGLDCLDQTPLLDLKPDRTLFTPIAPPQEGDFQVGD
jgi:tRNA-Thr(GGU) m(6)t(6)A37 methyltransferase TsaA